MSYYEQIWNSEIDRLSVSARNLGFMAIGTYPRETILNGFEIAILTDCSANAIPGNDINTFSMRKS